jgi:hypothetical protein
MNRDMIFIYYTLLKWKSDIKCGNGYIYLKYGDLNLDWEKYKLNECAQHLKYIFPYIIEEV